jgi:PAS domain S-box-containing protein
MTLRDFIANVYGSSQQRKAPPDNNAEPVAPRQPRRDRRRADGRRRLDKRSSVVPRVLLVEPHDDTRALYTTLFEDVGCATYAVSSGRDAIAIAHQRLPDIVVMEIGVPDADGFTILQELRREPATADVPAVVVTSHVHFGLPERARQSGATLVLEKPVMPDVLLTAVDELLANTPPERLVRRQLRRSLMTLKKLGSRLDEHAQDRVRALLDRLQVAVLAIDADGRYVAASVGAERLIGLSREELLGMSVADAALAEVLPLAALWDAFRSEEIATSAATMRDRTGQHVPMAVSFAHVTPGLDVAAFAVAHDAAVL